MRAAAPRWPTRLIAAGVGLVFGFFLTASGLGDYRTIHRGLLLRDPYIYLMMAATVLTAATGLALLKRLGRTAYGGPLTLARHPVRRSTVYGAAVFGIGFGVGATCPGITVAMAATGGLYGLVVLAGIFGGLWLRGRVEAAEPRGQASVGRHRVVAPPSVTDVPALPRLADGRSDAPSA